MNLDKRSEGWRAFTRLLIAIGMSSWSAAASAGDAMSIEARVTERLVDAYRGDTEVRICLTNTNRYTGSDQMLVAGDRFLLVVPEGCGRFESVSASCAQDLSVWSGSGLSKVDFECRVDSSSVELEFVAGPTSLAFEDEVCVNARFIATHAGSCALQYKIEAAGGDQHGKRIAPVTTTFLNVSAPMPMLDSSIPPLVPRSPGVPTSCPISVDPCLIGPTGPQG